jgi:tRNA threonylcarbamoyladenosine biosynthesis protein TsaE
MPILNEHALDLTSHSTAQTIRLGARLGALLQAGDVICLEGDLGTGKTCLTKGIGRGMGITEPLTSPTFTLIAEHWSPTLSLVLYHIDLYRLGAPVAEALSLGLDDFLEGDGVCVIEWADRIASALPGEVLWISLRHLDATKRGMTMQASGRRYEEIVRQFRLSAFRAQGGEA